MIKTLTINGIEYAKYLAEGELLYLKVIQNIIIGNTKDSERELINIISLIEKKHFSHASYLNID